MVVVKGWFLRVAAIVAVTLSEREATPRHRNETEAVSHEEMKLFLRKRTAET